METLPVISIRDAKAYVGKDVTIQGWLYNKRSSGKIRFLEIRDGSVETLQAVVMANLADAESFEISDKISQESSLKISGLVKENPRKPGVFELDTKKIELVQMAPLDYPIGHKEHGPEHLMANRHLWLRSPRQVAILRTRAKIVQGIRSFFDNRGFVLMDAPMLTPSACEGTSELFETDYFDGKAYLTQSGQLYGEAGAMALGKIYTFGPTFRAEKSKTRKHLTEFWMIEPEVAFCDIEGVMELAEAMVKATLSHCLETCVNELKVLGRNTEELARIAKEPFPRIPYNDAIALLNKNGFSLKFGDDFGAPEETKLGELFNGLPVFIMGFPKEMKSFYFKVDPKDPRMVLGCDLIAPNGYGEIIGGSEREADYETLKANLKKSGLSEENYSWYLDLRKYGSVPHGGFGLGLERTVAWICGLDHVRETIPFPRLINYIRP